MMSPAFGNCVLDDVLNEIEEFLEQRADADGTPDGYRPNQAMRLLMDLQAARKQASDS